MLENNAARKPCFYNNSDLHLKIYRNLVRTFSDIPLNKKYIFLLHFPVCKTRPVKVFNPFPEDKTILVTQFYRVHEPTAIAVTKM